MTRALGFPNADAQRRAYTVKFDAYATPRDIAYRTRLERL